MNQDVLIIGGGFAGLSTAVELASHRYRVTLLEKREILGGRASSFLDSTTGDIVDNGQHLFMGCYTYTIAFLKKIGSLEKLKFQENLNVDFAGKAIGLTSLACPSLPAPLHLLGGLLGLKSLSFRDKLSLARAGLSLFLSKGKESDNLDHLTVDEWLTLMGQPERVRRNFWNIVTIATLNESPKIASAQLFVRVIQEALLSGKEKSRIAISTVGLSELYTEDAQKFLEAHGGEVIRNANVVTLEIRHGQVEAVKLKSGERLQSDLYISAVPHFALRHLLPKELLEEGAPFSALNSLKSSPILAINLWFDRPITDREFIGLLDTQVHWVFNKGAIFSHPHREGAYLSLVISGAHDLVHLSKEELLHLALKELQELFPEARRATLLHHLIIKEKRATLSPEKGIGKIRLSQKTPFSNFFLVGDWTDTGLPATIEGAVYSGKKCVDFILEADR
ncbi:MAG: FAD-dependent oxidoreductase [Candidatus Tectomicrobia bacterium]|nr:FAD-dependent oxidoreductase [Candidatus Tectomicrobia bacterium]